MKLSTEKVVNLIRLDETKESAIYDMLFTHFSYSIKDIKSYDELTDDEKSFIPRDLFELITSNN